MPVCPVHIVVIADNVSTMHVHRCAYNSCNMVQCVHMPISTTWFTHNHARIFDQWLIHSIASPYCQHSADRKQSFHKCLRRRSRNQILSNQRQNWVNVWLFFVTPEFDGTATKRTCVDVSDVGLLINVASDRSDHQCCRSCMALAWLLLLCQLGVKKWENN